LSIELERCDPIAQAPQTNQTLVGEESRDQWLHILEYSVREISSVIDLPR
jgi:hypothetical protein